MYLFKTHGTCSKQITFEVDSQNKVRNIAYEGGCSGNLKILGQLLEGKTVDEVINRLEGLKCDNRDTSCPDQLARALRIYKKQIKSNESREEPPYSTDN